MSDKIYNPFDKMDFIFQKCLLTGKPIQSENEIVNLFPDWMMEKFNLHQKTITFLSGNLIEYQNLKVPISNEAQTKGLAYLERTAKDLLNAGHEGVKWIKPEMLYNWLAYLYYGILYYEIYLAKENLNKKNEFLFEPEYTNRFQILHLILQGIVRKVEFYEFVPESIVAFKTHEYESKFNFDLKININTFSLGLRLGDLGLIACLLDNGIQKKFFENYFEKFAYQILHPIQFDEMYSKVVYKAYLMNLPYEYGISLPDDENESILISLRIPDEQKDTPVFMEWKNEIYAQILKNHLKPYKIPNLKILENNEVITFLEKEDGATIQMDKNGNALN